MTWADVNGSKHNLDFVLEKGGTDESIGEPIAFIELAWRRYTKHSKNKVQEIAGALNPIFEKYRLNNPFKGAILSGQFTENSINQLKNDNFHVLYIPFDILVRAFRKYGFDIDFGEDTKETDLRKKFAAVSNKKSKPILKKVREEILKTCRKDIDQFVAELKTSYNRKIKTICILPLHGKCTEVINIEKAIDFINGYNKIPVDINLEYIEIIVNYNNGSSIKGQFKEKDDVLIFLNSLK